ncbi:probable membrane protein b2001 [Weissella confusa]|uniref:hypothetical protein n=2 Tax=Weissella confusa TaxID=1583 RepID=UPI0009899F81|nr:hypothetical protein [Weissella confusa]SJX68977.1 probable membrane protein b2001 [Weissella confusa]
MGYLFFVILILYIANKVSDKMAGVLVLIDIVIYIRGFIVYPKLFAIATTVFIILAIIGMNDGESKRKRQFKKWLARDAQSTYTLDSLDDSFEKIADSLQCQGDDIPYGRAEYFLSSFDDQDGEVLAYSPIMSLIELQLREFGAVVTSRGMGFSQQTGINEKTGQDTVESVWIPYSGMWNVEIENDETFSVNYGSKIFTTPIGYFVNVDFESLVINLNDLIESGFTRDLYTGVFDKIAENTEIEESSNDLISQEAKLDLVNNEARKADLNIQIDEEGKRISSGLNTLSGTVSNYNLHNIQTNQMVNGPRGYGVGAEYANSVHDGGYLTDSVLKGQDNAKHGVDRLSFGNQVQVKTSIKGGTNSIKLAFDHGEYSYGDMPTEVPKDQYAKSLEYMRNKIENGKVPGHTNPADAKMLVKKGPYSTNFYANVVKAGTIESLYVDTMNAVQLSLPAAGISFVMQYAVARWNGQEQNVAVKQAGYAALRTGAISTGIIVFASQTAKSEVVNRYASKLAMTTLGRQVGFNPEAVGKYAGGVAVVAITFGPSIVDSLRGRISVGQLVKNSVVGAASIAGGVAAGAAVGSVIPVVGTFIGAAAGGLAASTVAKKVMDNFIEDDAKEMFEIFKEEFIDVVMPTGFSQEEFSQVIEMTFQNKKMSSWLKDMFASGDARLYAREELISEAVISVLRQRESISESEIIDAYEMAENEFGVA